MDVHKKEESTGKYNSLGELDPKKMLKTLSKDPMGFMSPLFEIAKIMKIVQFDEKEFEHLSVDVFPDKDFLLSSVQKKKKEYVIPKETGESLMKSIRRLSWFECKGGSQRCTARQ